MQCPAKTVYDLAYFSLPIFLCSLTVEFIHETLNSEQQTDSLSLRGMFTWRVALGHGPPQRSFNFTTDKGKKSANDDQFAEKQDF